MIFNKYSQTIPGALAQTGNTLGLCAGSDGIGSFTVADISPPGGNRTTDYNASSSAAFLTIPDEAYVEYAILMWVGTFNSASPIGETESVSLKAPSGVSHAIAPDPANYLTDMSTPAQAVYHNAAEITDIVRAEGTGFYTVGGAPSITGTPNVTVGWQIIAVYSVQNAKHRNINVWCGLESIRTAGSLTIPISGFTTPSETTPSGRIVLGMANGDSGITNDFVKFGETEATAIALYGPNNPADNFLCSQINNDEGLLDKTGTFGNSNASIGVQPTEGLRYSFDVTNIDVSYALKNNQTSGVIIMGTSGDVYQVFGIGLQIDVNQAIILPFIKTVDKARAKRGDTLTYTISLQNTGDASAYDTILTDIIPDCTEFVEGSVYINGINQPGANPNAIELGILPSFQTEPIIISFQVTVNEYPQDSVIGNSASINCKYIPAPGEAPAELSVTSTPAETVLENYCTAALIKTAGIAYAAIGDTIAYNIQITADGNAPASNFIIYDEIPEGALYVNGTLMLDGIPISGSLSTGVNLGSLSVGIHNLTFSALVNSMPPQNPLQNTSRAEYDYSILSGEQSETQYITSNEAETLINTASLIAEKSVDKANVTVGSLILYTITIKNTGNISAANVTIMDPLPPEAPYTVGTLRLNGMPFAGVFADGINIQTILPGETAVLTFNANIIRMPFSVEAVIYNQASIDFEYTVDPSGEPVEPITISTNTVTTKVFQAEMDMQQTSDKQFLDLNEEVTFTFTISNTGTVNADNVIFTDILPEGLTFVDGSIIYDGSPITGNPSLGIPLGTIETSAVLSFRAISHALLPDVNTVDNKATIQYDYTLTPDDPPEPTETIESNMVTITINAALPELVKTVDTAYSQIGGELEYSITITNTGTVSADDIIFNDMLPEWLEYITGSLLYNGTAIQDGTENIPLGTLAAQGSGVLIFRARVISSPPVNPHINTAEINYTYSPEPGGTAVGTKTAISNDTVTTILNAECTAVKTSDLQYAKCGSIITYRITVTNTGNTAVINVSISDPPPSGTEFVPGSLTINSIRIEGITPSDPIPIGSLEAGASAVVSYRAEVICV